MDVMLNKGKWNQAAARITQQQKEPIGFVPVEKFVPRSQSEDSLAKGGDSSEDASEQYYR